MIGPLTLGPCMAVLPYRVITSLAWGIIGQTEGCINTKHPSQCSQCMSFMVHKAMGGFKGSWFILA